MAPATTTSPTNAARLARPLRHVAQGYPGQAIGVRKPAHSAPPRHPVHPSMAGDQGAARVCADRRAADAGREGSAEPRARAALEVDGSAGGECALLILTVGQSLDEPYRSRRDGADRAAPRQPHSEVHRLPELSVRYIVNDVEEAIDFYRDRLGFVVDMHPAPGFTRLTKGSLALLLNQPGAGGAGQAMPDGTMPRPGGWNRIQLEVDDLDATVDGLRKAGCQLRSEIITGQGGRQILVDDPSGNAVELFESA